MTDDKKPGSGASDLFELLLTQGHLTDSSAEQARRRQRRGRISAEQALLDLGTVSQEVIFRGVAEINNLEFVVLSETQVGKEAIEKVPAKVALHYGVTPVALERGTLTMAFSEPPGVRDRENLRMLVGARIKPVISSPADIGMTTKRHYGLGADTVLQIRQDRDLQARVSDDAYDRDPSQELSDGSDEGASISRLVNQILLEALSMSATDVHIEPFQDTIQLRYRIDGFLNEIPTPPGLRELHSAIISRMKVMANLDIAERRLPHDGRVRVSIGNQEFDLRVSILPTRFGETLNLRILSRQTIYFDLDQLGLEQDHLRILKRLLDLPHGMILVTGPTGSGKTTTLYGSLDKTNKGERKVITVEDPVEYQLGGISQIQINDGIGLTFASCLRSILRHDPDIILVGEIRDAETAEIAIRAALTGHLVLSTLHTNDSVGAVNRLCDMNVEPYLVASSLSASMAQRLVRRICPHCKTPDTQIPDNVLREMAGVLECDKEEIEAWRGEGCIECGHNGYRGRVAIYEFFLMNDELEDLVTRGATTTELRTSALKSGMRTLRQDGWIKVTKGLTSIEEVLRITTAFDIRY